MGLFAYYALHSFKNQIKKLFKTWIFAFIIICGLMGGLIGFGVAKLEDAAPVDPGTDITEDIELPGESPVDDTDDEPVFDFSEHPEYLELVAGGIVFAVIVFFALSADKGGGKLFLPADVNLLFSSPMKPQSVLLFRLITKLGLVLFMCIYFLLEVPMMLSFGLPLKGILLLYVVVFVSIVYGQLIQAVLYIKLADSNLLKKMLTPVCYGIMGVLVLGYGAYWKGSGLGNLEAATKLFTGGFSDYIPIWGWIKACYKHFLGGNIIMGIVMLALVVLGLAAVAYILMKLKPDFYEEAMKKAEETAAILRDAQENSSLFMAKKKKDRGDKIARDGFNKGHGASVYYHKILYNRKRFATLGYFTKTCITYLLASIVISIFQLKILETSSYVVIALALGVMVYYRALGNPLERDLATPYFVLIPDSMWKKLFYTLLGNTVNCMLDLIPGMIIAALLLKTNPLLVPVWILFIVTVDFYSSTVGSFISISVPVSAGKTLKSLVQVLFIYFGLIPDVAIMAVGITFNHTAIAVIAASVINIGLGFVFLGMSPEFIAPKSGRYYSIQPPLSPEMLKKARKAFSLAGISISVVLVVSTALQLGLAGIVGEFIEKTGEWLFWIFSFAPIYLVGMPAGYLFLRKLEKKPFENGKIKISDMIKAFFICEFLMILGNIIGQLVGLLVSNLSGTQTVNNIGVLIDNTGMFWQLLIVVIIGPIMEELFCRKLIIDRISVYGEKKAVFISALIFGLFHGNIYQYFYAFAIGLVFGYVYLRSGKLRYSIALHMIFNFMGSILPQLVLNGIDFDVLDSIDIAAVSDAELFSQLLNAGFGLYIIYILWIIVAFLIGAVFFFNKIFNLEFKEAPVEIQKGKGFVTCYLNPGMIILTIVSVGLVVYSMIAV